jgi:hypothetical protein
MQNKFSESKTSENTGNTRRELMFQLPFTITIIAQNHEKCKTGKSGNAVLYSGSNQGGETYGKKLDGTTAAKGFIGKNQAVMQSSLV